MLEIIDNQTDVRGFDCADRVVGKGAAFLYVLLNVARVHACVISKVALEVLRDCNIEVTYYTLAERIENRTKTGYCPIEEAVLDITAPNEALIAIKNKLKELTK